MGGVDFASAGGDAAEGDEFFGRGGGAGGVHEAGGEAGGASGEALGEALFHGVQLGWGGWALAGAHGGDAERAMADEGTNGDEFGLGFGVGEILLSVTPGPIAVVAEENAVGELLDFVAVGSAGIGRKAAVSDDFGGDALICFGAVAGEDLEVRVAVKVNEAGGDDEAGAVDLMAVGGGVYGADGEDGAAIEEEVAGVTRGAGAVDEGATVKQGHCP